MSNAVLFHYLWDRQILIPFAQPHLKAQSEDTKKALSCPVYTDAIKRSIYLVANTEFSIMWHGGKSVTIKSPPMWQETFDRASEAWEAEGHTREFRFSTGSPLGGSNGGIQLHQGGLMLNFFTGISIETPPGIAYLVTRPWNNFHSAWTIQDGVYSPDFVGDFSLNIHLLQTGVPIVFRRGELVATLFFFQDRGAEEPFEIPLRDDERTNRRKEEARRFYERKQNGEGYRKQCPMA